MKKSNKLLLLIVLVIGALAVSGCADNTVKIEQHNPSVEDFSVYMSGTDGVFDKGDEITFTLEYKLEEDKSVQDYKSLPLDVDIIVLKPDALDVEFNHIVSDVKFYSEDGKVLDSIAPNTKATLKVTIPPEDAKWDEIASKVSTEETIDFVLAIQIKGLSHPIKSNVFKINV